MELSICCQPHCLNISKDVYSFINQLTTLLKKMLKDCLLTRWSTFSIFVSR